MVTAVPLFYTGLIACLNIIASGGGSNLFPPEQFAGMSQEEISERIKGSKIVIVSEQVRTSQEASMKADSPWRSVCLMLSGFSRRACSSCSRV